MKTSEQIWGQLSGARAGLGKVTVFEVENLEEIRTLIASGRRLYPVGHGTNLVGSDEDLDIVAIKLSREGFGKILVDGNRVTAGCGQPLGNLLRQAAEQGVGGASALVGIPGTLGAALAGNVGAKEHSIFEYVEDVWGIDLQNGQKWCWHAGDGGWAYRKSPVPAGVLVYEATLNLAFCHVASEKALIEAELTRRRQTTPPYPTLGSTFKNPLEAPAGKLLEETGCKGLAQGVFQVYENHANWVLNRARQVAPAADYRNLLNQMKQRVLDTKGIALQEEVRFIQ